MRKVIVVAAIIVLSLFTCSTIQAQRAGFIVGIAPMSNPVVPMTNPVMPFAHASFGYGFPAQVPIIVGAPTGFLGNGLITAPAGHFAHRHFHAFGISHVHVVPHTFPTVIVPGTVRTDGPRFATSQRRFRTRTFGGHRFFRR